MEVRRKKNVCHESFLYNVLKDLKIDFYDWNNKHKNRALYLNRGLYSEGIWFFRDDKHVNVVLLHVLRLTNQQLRNIRMYQILKTRWC